MARKLKIVIGGYAVGFPLGGQMWMMVHYALGLAKLGHEVLFVEDSADWALPFDPLKGYPSHDSSFGRKALDEAFARCGLQGRWFYNSLFEGRSYGLPQEDMERFCAQADLFLNVSGVIPLRECFLKPPVKVIIDTDPVFTQSKIASDSWTKDYYLNHDAFFTFGRNIPSGSTGVPLSGIEYVPTSAPVVLELWPALNTPGSGFTTIGTWDAQGRDIELDGKKLSWRKCEKYERIIDLPGKLPGVTLDLTMSGMRESAARFAEHGWQVKDALVVSRDAQGYREYVAGSTGEFTVAKEQNIQLKSGWFSDRSATYLASGRPVIVEDTGFGTYLPVGKGLVTFDGVENAMDAIQGVLRDYEAHRRAARRIAEEHFDSDKVLGHMLRTVGLA